MKLYKVSVMTKVYGYEYFYQKHGDYILVTDKLRRFLVDVKPQEPPARRKTTFVPTILHHLAGQKCILNETDDLLDWMCRLKMRHNLELAERTGIVLPYGEDGADVIQTQSDRLVMADKYQLDVFNWYELFVDDEIISGIYCDGLFFMEALPYTPTSKVTKTISLLNESR